LALAADRERERAVLALRRHYEAGRLEVEEFAERAELALRARTTGELRAALRDLPRFAVGEAIERGRAAAGDAAFVAVLVFAWMAGSFVLLAALGFAFLAGSGGGAFLVLSLAWVVFTGLLWLAGRRRLRLRSRRT
jgi:hypothetical protein